MDDDYIDEDINFVDDITLNTSSKDNKTKLKEDKFGKYNRKCVRSKTIKK